MSGTAGELVRAELMSATGADSYLEQVEQARRWYDLVCARLARGWRPTEREMSICAEIAMATWWPSPTPPPHEDEPLAVRIGRIRQWVAVAQLAAAAGRWTLAPAPATLASTDDELLPGLLSVLHQVASPALRWHAAHDKLWEPGPPGIHRWPTDEFPRLREHLGTAERLFGGVGGVGELFCMVGSGEFDW